MSHSIAYLQVLNGTRDDLGALGHLLRDLLLFAGRAGLLGDQLLRGGGVAPHGALGCGDSGEGGGRL